jgi:hypothetical protein
MLGLKPYGLVLVALGIAVAIFGLVAGSFHLRLPGLQSEVKRHCQAGLGACGFSSLGRC